MKMFRRDGSAIDIPDDQAQEAFQSGDFGFAPDAKIPVITRSGKQGTISGANADEVFARGGRMLMPEEAHEAEIQAKYGDVGGMAAAAGEGLARGITGGAIDPLAIGTARMLMGEQAAEATRQHLAGEREANPWTSGLSEAGGMVLPLLLGPAGAAVEGAGAALEGGSLAARGLEGAGALAKGIEGAEAAGEVGAKLLHGGLPSASEASALGATEGKLGAAAAEGVAEAPKGAEALVNEAAATGVPQPAARGIIGTAAEGLGQGIRNLGAIPRANVAVGELAERALTKIVGKEASSFAGKTAQKIIAKAGGAAVENALFSAEQEIDEEVLGNKDLNAEKILQAAKHGSILGGSLGGILTGGGALAREVAGRSAPMLEKLAGFNMWKAAAPKLKYTKEAMARAGGASEVGLAALREGINGHTVDELATQTQAALDKRMVELRELYRNSPARVHLSKVEEAFNEEIAKYKDQPLYSKIVKGLEDAKAQAIGGLAPEMAEAATVAHMPKGPVTPADLKELQAKHGAQLFDMGEAGKALRESLGLELNPQTLSFNWVGKPATTETVAKAAGDTLVPIQKLIEMRQALGKIAYKEAKALDPAMRVEALRNVYGKLADLENTEMDAVSRAMGKGPQKAELEALRKRYQRLSIYNDALTDSVAKGGTNRRVSLTDYMMAAGAVASGHPVGAAVYALGHKLLRERGSAWSAQVLHKIAAYGAMERATSSIDRQIERGVAGFFNPGERAGVRLRRAVQVAGPYAARKAADDKDYNDRVERVARAVAYADQHADHAAKVADAIRAHAPQTANSLQGKIMNVTSQLAKAIPPGHVPNTMTPHLEKPKVSEADKAKFKRADDMSNDPVGTTFDRLNRGMLTQSDVQNLRNMYPETYNQIVDLSMRALGQQGKKLDYMQRVQLSILLDHPYEMSLGPMLLPTLQQTFGPPAKEDEPKDRGTPPRRELKDMAKAVNLSSGINDSLPD